MGWSFLVQSLLPACTWLQFLFSARQLRSSTRRAGLQSLPGMPHFWGLLTLLLGSLLGRFLLISFSESALATVKRLGRVGHSPTPTFSSLTQAPVLSGPLGMPTFLRWWQRKGNMVFRELGVSTVALITTSESDNFDIPPITKSFGFLIHPELNLRVMGCLVSVQYLYNIYLSLYDILTSLCLDMARQTWLLYFTGSLPSIYSTSNGYIAIGMPQALWQAPWQVRFWEVRGMQRASHCQSSLRHCRYLLNSGIWRLNWLWHFYHDNSMSEQNCIW